MRSRSGAITFTPGYVRLERELEAQLVVALAGAAVHDRLGAEVERDLARSPRAITGRESAEMSGYLPS